MKINSFAIFLVFAANSIQVHGRCITTDPIDSPITDYIDSVYYCDRYCPLYGKAYYAPTYCCDNGYCDCYANYNGPWRNLNEDEGAVLARLEDSAKERGATIIYKEERDDILQLCKNEEYQGGLVVSEGPHFSFVALAQEPKLPECSVFGFDSALGQKVMVKGSVDSFKSFHAQDITFSLNDVVQGFDKAKPLEGFGTNLAMDSCLHFAERIWLEIGLPWSEELGDFIVDSMVSDDNFVNMAREKGGGALFAASLLGPDALKRQVEHAVFSHGARRGLNTSKEFDTSARDLRALGEDNGCSDQMYQVDLVIEDTGMIGVFTEATDENAPCPRFLLTTDTTLQKAYIVVDNFQDALNHITLHHGVVNTEGQFTYSSIAHAYETASVYGHGHEGEDFDFAFNNNGDFIAHFFEKLGHCSSEAETVLIAATFVNVLENSADVANEMRQSLVASGDVVNASDMADMEVFAWAVGNRTQSMYCTN